MIKSEGDYAENYSWNAEDFVLILERLCSRLLLNLL